MLGLASALHLLAPGSPLRKARLGSPTQTLLAGLNHVLHTRDKADLIEGCGVDSRTFHLGQCYCVFWTLICFGAPAFPPFDLLVSPGEIIATSIKTCGTPIFSKTVASQTKKCHLDLVTQ